MIYFAYAMFLLTPQGAEQESSMAGEAPVQDTDQTEDVETVEIVPERTEKGWRYVDPVLAQIAQELNVAREQERAIKRKIKALEVKQQRRIRALTDAGPLREWPTDIQRKIIATFEMAMQFNMVEILAQSYKLCIDNDVHKTRYLFGGEEPIETAYARRMTEIGGK